MISKYSWNKVVTLVIMCSLSSIYSKASQIKWSPPDTAKTGPVNSPQEDIMDVVRKIVKAKYDHDFDDSAKLKPWVFYPAIFPAVGYTLVNGGTATVSGNVSFYTDSIDVTNLSTITISPLVSTDHQFTIPVISTLWSKNNRFNFLGDWRFYKYPSYTYGLGGHTSLSNADMIDYSYINVLQEALYHLGKNIYAGLGYNFDYHYNLQNTTTQTDYSEYNGHTLQTTSSGIIAHIKYDSRTNINYPNDAFYSSILYRYNTTFLGSDNDWQALQIELREYIKVGGVNHNNVLAFWSWNEFTFGGKVPYFDLPSTGWDTYANTGRGYIQGRYRGTSLLYLEGEYRFEILKNGLLGGVVFLNGESVPEWPENKFETINTGEGIGLRIKMNRYSKTNLCIDYGVGNGGSRGFFFNLGEVF